MWINLFPWCLVFLILRYKDRTCSLRYKLTALQITQSRLASPSVANLRVSHRSHIACIPTNVYIHTRIALGSGNLVQSTVILSVLLPINSSQTRWGYRFTVLWGLSMSEGVEGSRVKGLVRECHSDSVLVLLAARLVMVKCLNREQRCTEWGKGASRQYWRAKNWEKPCQCCRCNNTRDVRSRWWSLSPLCDGWVNRVSILFHVSTYTRISISILYLVASSIHPSLSPLQPEVYRILIRVIDLQCTVLHDNWSLKWGLRPDIRFLLDTSTS